MWFISSPVLDTLYKGVSFMYQETETDIQEEIKTDNQN